MRGLAIPPAVSSLGGLRTPTPRVCRATIMGPASANLHNNGLMQRMLNRAAIGENAKSPD